MIKFNSNVVVIANDKIFEKGEIKDVYLNLITKVNSALLTKMDTVKCSADSFYPLTDIKKRLLKCTNISSECKIFRDVAAVVFINIPKRYENFLADIFYNEYEMDMFFEYFGYERMVFKYNIKKEELSYIDYGEE